MPIFSDKSFSVEIIFESFDLKDLLDPFLKSLTKLSNCLTDSFFLIILSVNKSAFSDQLKL